MKTYKLLSVSIGVILSLLLAEVVMRFYHFNKLTADNLILSSNENLVYEHKPSITFINRYGIKVKYNSLGFIGEEIGSKTEDTFRILGVGDSTTDGTYLPQAQRYLNLLGKILETKINRRIEIVNAGIGGYNTWQELEIIKDKGLLIKPDLIIVGICLNDYIENKPKLGQSWFGRIAQENFNDGSRARYFNFVYQKSALYKFIYDFLSNARRTGYGQKGYQRYLEEYNFDIKPSDFQKWKKPFIEMMALTKKNKIKILFVIFPLHNQIIKGENVSYKPLSDFFKEENAYFLDLIKYFNGYSQEGKVLFIKRDIIHFNVLGHSITAEVIADYILKNKILE